MKAERKLCLQDCEVTKYAFLESKRTRFEEGAHLSEHAMARGAAQAERPNENRT